MSVRARLSAIGLALAWLVLCGGAGIAQPVISEHRTPAGIAFRHVALPGDITHALTFAWADGFGQTLAGKEGVVILGPRLLLEGDTPTMSESARIERLRDLQASISWRGVPNSRAEPCRRPRRSSATPQASSPISSPTRPCRPPSSRS